MSKPISRKKIKIVGSMAVIIGLLVAIAVPVFMSIRPLECIYP